MKTFLALFVAISSVLLINCEVTKDLGVIKGQSAGKDVCKYEKLIIEVGKSGGAEETDSCRSIKCGSDFKGTLLTCDVAPATKACKKFGNENVKPYPTCCNSVCLIKA